MTTGDEYIWESDALARFCEHPRADIRSWALARIRDRRATELASAVFARLDDPDTNVAFDAIEAADALRERVSLEGARDPLRALLARELPPGTALRATALLARSGDPNGVERLEAECRKPSPGGYWEVLVEVAPAHARAVIEALVFVSKTQAWPHETEAAFAATATIKEASRFIARRDWSGESAEFFLWTLLQRCDAEHLWVYDEEGSRSALEGLLDTFGRAWPEADLAAHGLTLDALAPVLAHLDASRWADALVECAARCERGPHEDEPDAWTRALCYALAALKAPRGLHAWTACALVIAQGQRALMRARPFDEAPVAEQFARACMLSHREQGDYFDRVIARVAGFAPDAPERDRVSERFGELVAPPASFAQDAFELAARLPGLPLPRAAVLCEMEALSDDAASARVRCLAAHPESLRLLADEAFAQGDERQLLGVLEAFEKAGRRWMTEAALGRLDALLREVEPEFVRNLFGSLGDPAALTKLVDLWRPGEAQLAIVVEPLAVLSGRAGELPPALVEEARAEQARMDALSASFADPDFLEKRLQTGGDQPFRLDLECNRSGRVGTYIVERVTAHPDRAKCQREGWDGYVFDRVIVCKYCGAEDDYTLTRGADRSLTLHTFMALTKLGSKPSRESLTEGRMWFGVPGTSDGTPIRRQSDAVRHWTRKTEQSPRDAQAWLRLGNVLRQSGRYDPALAAYRHAIAVRDDHVEAMAGLLDTLVELGRQGEEPDLARRILGSMSKLPPGSELRAMVAPLLVGVMRGAVESGQALALMAAWLGGRAHDRQVMNTSAVDLRRVTRWDRVAEFIASPNVMGLSLKDAAPDEADTLLEELIESDIPLRSAGPPKGVAQAPYVRAEPRIGRNDPCHCGSGKKYKKCHGK